jgi:hypothetical protein
VSAASGSGASSASGRKRSRRRPRQLLADPNAEAFAGVPADRDQLPDAIPRLFLRRFHLLTIAAPAAIFLLNFDEHSTPNQGRSNRRVESTATSKVSQVEAGIDEWREIEEHLAKGKSDGWPF